MEAGLHVALVVVGAVVGLEIPWKIHNGITKQDPGGWPGEVLTVASTLDFLPYCLL